MNKQADNQKQIDVIRIAQKQRYAHLIEKMKSGKSLSRAEIDNLAEIEEQFIRPAEDRFSPGQIFKTQRQAADYTDVSVRTIQRWLKAGMPVTEDGYFIAGILDFFKRSGARAVDENRQRLARAEAELKETKAALANIELQKQKGELLYASDIEQKNAMKVIAIKRALLGLGRGLALQLSKMGDNPARIQDVIDREIRQIIGNFAK